MSDYPTNRFFVRGVHHAGRNFDPLALAVQRLVRIAKPHRLVAAVQSHPQVAITDLVDLRGRSEVRDVVGVVAAGPEVEEVDARVESVRVLVVEVLLLLLQLLVLAHKARLQNPWRNPVHELSSLELPIEELNDLDATALLGLNVGAEGARPHLVLLQRPLVRLCILEHRCVVRRHPSRQLVEEDEDCCPLFNERLDFLHGTRSQLARVVDWD
jgi:hypothetical protein